MRPRHSRGRPQNNRMRLTPPRGGRVAEHAGYSETRVSSWAAGPNQICDSARRGIVGATPPCVVARGR